MALKFSFILPCYNVEQYIGRCLDSILNQDIPHDEYEIICVNDCSPDNLSDVVRQYQQRYPNVVLIEHTENKTAGGARNTGIEHAKGEYIWFVDPDDRIMPNSLCKLWEEVKDEKLDILFFNHNLYTYGGKLIDYNIVPNSEILNGQEYLQKYFPLNITKISSVCNELMRSCFIKDSNIRFPEIAASQDVVFLWEVICNASNVKSVENTYYSVFRRKNSTTGMTGRLTAKTCFSFCILCPISVLSMIKRNIISKSIQSELFADIYQSVNDDSKILYRLSCKEKAIFYNKLRSNIEKLNIIKPYMNLTTQRLLKLYKSFYIWLFVVDVHSIWYNIKTKKNK